MRSVAMAIGLACALATCAAPAQDPVTAVEITAATLAAPPTLRQGASVFLPQRDATLQRVREGRNELMCITDDPARPGFHVVCYHTSLEPFMARGRTLRLEGQARPVIDSIRQAEIEGGQLAMPDHPAALYSLTSQTEEVDPETGIPTDARPLYVVYIPYATPASSGLSTTPAPGMPWLMYEGTPWAHVMISPP